MEEKLTLVMAVEGDVRVVWELNNEPAARQNSINQDPIPWEEHVKWYERSLESEDRALYLARVREDVIGTLRLDLAETAATISITLNSDFRGRGYGRRLIRACCLLAVETFGCDQVVALIRPENLASVKAFSAAGFEPDGQVKTENGTLLDRFIWRDQLGSTPGGEKRGK